MVSAVMGGRAGRPLRLLGLSCRSVAPLRNSAMQLCRNQPNRQRDPERDQKEIVEIPEHGDEVGNQVEGAQRIGGDETVRRFGIPGSSRIASGKP